MAAEIVKVQRPLSTSEASSPWMIYAAGKERRQILPEVAIPASVKKAMGDDLKGYFRAQWSSVVGWAIGERVAEQSW